MSMSNSFLLKDSAYYQTYFVDIKAYPFVKWVGGKRQIIDEIHNYLPNIIESTENLTYIEPFVGGGAVFFSLFPSPNIHKPVLIDNNPVLIITYKVIRDHIDEFIVKLSEFERLYSRLQENEQSSFYYKIRDEYNALVKDSNLEKFNKNWFQLASEFIFLNRTCFNGLYRVNLQGEFNVPIGSYNNPKICDSDNLFRVHKALQYTDIFHGDFEIAEKFVNSSSFIYLDPPYRPLSSSSFTSYTKTDFNDVEQKRLAKFCDRIDKLGGKFLLSNSDPKNSDPNDDFFDGLYSKYRMVRVNARRNINSNGNERGTVSELLIMNY